MPVLRDLGLTWAAAADVVIATAGIYLAFLVLIRVAGQRALASMSAFDFAAAVAFGAVIGRVVLGYTPTLLAGIIGLATLFLLQAVFGLLRRTRRIDHIISNLPVLLMANGRVIDAHLRRAHIAEDELREKLRLGGVRRYEDVAAVILERTGQFSIIRRGETIAADLVTDVRGCELLSASEISDDAASLESASQEGEPRAVG